MRTKEEITTKLKEETERPDDYTENTILPSIEAKFDVIIELLFDVRAILAYRCEQEGYGNYEVNSMLGKIAEETFQLKETEGKQE